MYFTDCFILNKYIQTLHINRFYHVTCLYCIRRVKRDDFFFFHIIVGKIVVVRQTLTTGF